MKSAAWLQRLRLWTGLVLVLFLTTHLLNHSLGNISLEAMEWGRRLFLGLWRNPVGSILLYGAVVLHMLVVILALLRRRRLAMPPGEAVWVRATSTAVTCSRFAATRASRRSAGCCGVRA